MQVAAPHFALLGSSGKMPFPLSSSLDEDVLQLIDGHLDDVIELKQANPKQKRATFLRSPMLPTFVRLLKT